MTAPTPLILPDRRPVRRAPPSPRPDAVPEIVQLLALAHAVERATEDGVATRATVARALGLTRARLTQVCLLAFLAPAIQAELIASRSGARVTERALRVVVAELDWGRQADAWRRVRTTLAAAGR